MNKGTIMTGILSTYYDGRMWKEFDHQITGTKNTDNGNAYGTIFKIGFYRDTPFSDKDLQAYIQKMTKHDNVEFLVLNGKVVYDRNKYKTLSDGQRSQSKDSVLETAKSETKKAWY